MSGLRYSKCTCSSRTCLIGIVSRRCVACVAFTFQSSAIASFCGAVWFRVGTNFAATHFPLPELPWNHENANVHLGHIAIAWRSANIVTFSGRHTHRGLRCLPSWRLKSKRTAILRVVEKIGPPLRLVCGRRRGGGNAQNR